MKYLVLVNTRGRWWNRRVNLKFISDKLTRGSRSPNVTTHCQPYSLNGRQHDVSIFRQVIIKEDGLRVKHALIYGTQRWRHILISPILHHEVLLKTIIDDRVNMNFALGQIKRDCVPQGILDLQCCIYAKLKKLVVDRFERKSVVSDRITSYAIKR